MKESWTSIEFFVYGETTLDGIIKECGRELVADRISIHSTDYVAGNPILEICLKSEDTSKKLYSAINDIQARQLADFILSHLETQPNKI